VTITEFLLARITEDEADASGAIGSHWDGSAYRQVRTASGDTPHYYKIASGQTQLEHWEPKERLNPGTTFQHIARHDPARVLAECAAKRAIIEQHRESRFFARHQGCVVCRTGSGPLLPVEYPCPTVRALAAVHKDHPDYQQEWAL
jgi:hypothetical protein